MKKWISLFLVAVILFSSIPLSAPATEVTDDTVISLAVTNLPDKVKYLPGETLDLTGLTAAAGCNDGTVKSLSAEELAVEVPDLSAGGNKIVTVSYGGQAASFEIHVHTVRVLEAVAPTYMNTGLTKGMVCEDPACAEILQEQEVLAVKSAPELASPDVAVKITAEGVALSWDAVEYAESYQVYRKTGTADWKLLDTVTGTSYTDTKAKSGVSVSYTVKACLQTAGGMVCSDDGAEKRVFFVAAKLINIAEGVSIQWTALDDASYYRVYRRLPGGSWETVCSKTTEDSFVDAAVESGVTYQYAVRARVNGSFTDYNYGLQVIRLSQPEAAVVNRAAGVELSWNKTKGAESYNIYRRVSGGSWELISTETGTVYVDASAESGTTYSYMVRAKNGSTLSSNKLRVTILRLARPSIKLSNISAGVSVKWDAIAGAESYRVYRKVSGGSWKTLATGVTALNYTDTTAKSGVTYYYSVRAYCDGTLSSNHLSVKLLRLDQPKVTVSNVYNGIQTEWNEITGAESYNVYRKTGDGSWKLLDNVMGTGYLDKTAKDGTVYSYMVRAKNGSTLSGSKQQVSVRRLAKTDVTRYNVTAGTYIEWNAVKGAETYRVYRRLPGGKWERLKANITDLNYTDTTAKSGVTYQYAVRAWNATGGSGYASAADIIRLSQPEAAVSNKSGGIQVTWNEVAGAKSYVVYRRIGSGSWEKLSTETDTDYLDTTAKSGTTYSYMVRAKNGSTLSGSKQRISILRLSRPNATVSNAYTGVSVKWAAVKGAESYRVMRKVSGGSWKTLATGVTDLKYTDTTAKSGTTYYYTVRAYGAGVFSGYTSTEAIQYLSRPAASAEIVSTTQVKISWNAVVGAQEYTVYAKTADTDWEKIYTGSKTTYTAKNLTFGETYSFRVRALSSDARSAQSATVTGKPTFLAPSYSVELKPGKGIKVSWTAVKGAGSYRVYRRTEGESWEVIKTTTSTSYVDTKGRSGTTYEYAVRAFELAGAQGVSGIRATGKTIVYSKIDPDKPMIALTFDDGPSQYTSDILDQLEKYDAHATFFVVGNRVSTYSKTIKRAYELGCEIGNHSWSHPSLSSLSVSSMMNELDKTDAAVKKIIGVEPTLLRPPYGAVDSDVKKYAGKPLILWSVDTRDWATQSSSSTINSVLNNARDGSIILMHDLYSATRTAAVSLIPTLIKRGYQLVTVSELAAYRGITLKDGTIYYSIYP